MEVLISLNWNPLSTVLQGYSDVYKYISTTVFNNALSFGHPNNGKI